MSGEVVELNGRERAILRAVAAGHAEITCSSEPDLFIDGVALCDQITAHRLAHRRLIVGQRSGSIGDRVPAALTESAWAMLGFTDAAGHTSAA